MRLILRLLIVITFPIWLPIVGMLSLLAMLSMLLAILASWIITGDGETWGEPYQDWLFHRTESTMKHLSLLYSPR